MSYQTTISFTVKKTGRKWLHIELAHFYKAKLLITPETAMLAPGDEVKELTVTDQSTRTRYGTDLVFEPVEGYSARPDAEALQRQAQLEAIARARAIVAKWLPLARADLQRGSYATKAITLMLDSDYAPYIEEKELAEMHALAAQNRRAWADYSHQQYLEREKARQERRASLDQRRTLFPLSELPPLDVPVKAASGCWLVYESYGCRFRIDCDEPSIEGAHLLGHEGDYGAYCYYRKATAEEIAAASQSQAA